jgi:hypothetical protein
LKISITELKEIVENSLNYRDAFRQVTKLTGMSDFRSFRKRCKRNKLVPKGHVDIETALGPIDTDKWERASVYIGKDGEVSQQWLKFKKGQEEVQEVLAAFTAGLTSKVKGRSTKIPAPQNTCEDLLVNYIQPEPHLGMFAWGQESPDGDYDLKVGEEILIEGTKRLVKAAPESDQCIIVDVCDWFHMDNKTNQTAKAGNQLDVDTRWPKVILVGAKIRRIQIEQALEKHRLVHVLFSPGNHDEHSAFMLAAITAAYFHNNPRVKVDLNPSMYKYHRFGKNLIGVHHGDKGKAVNLPLLMAADRPDDWGATRNRYWYTGHIHHKSMHELPGCVVESFRSVAAKDQWHSGQGYRSGRDMQSIVLHRDFGEVERHTISVAQIHAQSQTHV